MSSQRPQALRIIRIHSPAALSEGGNGRASSGSKGLGPEAAGHPASGRPDFQRSPPPLPPPLDGLEGALGG